MIDETKSEPAPHFMDARPPNMDERPAVFVERCDVKKMREAGFSEEEIRYSLALPDASESRT